VDLDQLLDAGGKIEPCPLLADANGSPAPEWFGHKKEVGDATTHILSVVASGSPRGRRQWGTRVADQLAAGLVQADHGPLGIERALVDG
jgi:hypothetical protein